MPKMRVLQNITIDAGVFAFPDVKICTENDINQYVETLLGWHDILKKPWIAVHMSERAYEYLSDDDVLPTKEKFNELIKAHSIQCNFKEIITIFNSFINKSQSFESFCQVDVVSEQTETVPDIGITTFDTSLQSNLAQCILLIALLHKLCSPPLNNHTFILREIPNQLKRYSKCEVSVKASDLLIDSRRTDFSVFPSSLESFQGEVSVCDNFQSLIKTIDESRIFADAVDDIEVDLAIKITLFKEYTNQGSIPDWHNLINVPTIGSKFRDSYIKVCKSEAPSMASKILKAILNTALGRDQSGREPHEIRTGPGGNDPPKIRKTDKAKAFRCKIDDKCRLHYWKSSNDKVELASVNRHEEFQIPE